MDLGFAHSRNGVSRTRGATDRSSACFGNKGGARAPRQQTLPSRTRRVQKPAALRAGEWERQFFGWCRREAHASQDLGRHPESRKSGRPLADHKQAGSGMG